MSNHKSGKYSTRIGLIGGTEKMARLIEHLIDLNAGIQWAILQEPEVHEDHSAYKSALEKLASASVPCKVADGGDLEETVKSFGAKPDVIFCTGWRRLLPQCLLDYPAEGVIVAHDSLLPLYRGRATLNWQIIMGERRTGLTLFKADNLMDHGPVFMQNKIDIGPKDNVVKVNKAICCQVGPLFEKWLAVQEIGQMSYHEQDHTEATYTCARKPADGLIDWRQSAHEVHNLVRALTSPWPQAFTYLNGRRVEIARAKVSPCTLEYIGRIPGRVVSSTVEGVDVLCGSGLLRILEITDSDGQTRPAQQLAASVKDSFGPA